MTFVSALACRRCGTRAGKTAVIGCAAGKDRTGIVAAMLLELLGGDREPIVADFVESNAVFPRMPLTRAQLDPVFELVDRSGGIETFLGEVMGLDADLGIAYAKSQMAAGAPLPLGGKVFISVSDMHKDEVAEVARQYTDLGFELIATGGTAAVLEKAGLQVQRIHKLQEGRPNAVDLLKNKEIQLVINTPSGAVPRADEVKIRTTAVYTGTPIMTTLSSARAAALGIAALKKSGYSVKPVQEYH